MNKKISILAMVFLFFPVLAFADGGVVHFDPYADRWDFSNETNQQAFINYEKGVEKMILSIGTGDLQNGKTMWLFPVPADPSKVSVDVVDRLPSLNGEEISKRAQANLDETTLSLAATQIYSIPAIYLQQNLLSAGSSFDGDGLPAGTSLGSGSLRSSVQSDVVVYDHIEKEGITSEIITARTPQGFNDYFKKKGIKMDNASIPVLGKYIGQNFSFVVSWIETANSNSAYSANKANNPPFSGNSDEYGNSLSPANYGGGGEVARNQKGVFVTFPTDKIFFPLMPTSVYGSKVVPANIRIIGHISPEIYPDIASFTKVRYFSDDYADFSFVDEAFYNGSKSNLKYTKIEINAPSKLFTDDLRASNSAPLWLSYQKIFQEHPVVVGILVLLTSSFLAGALIGWLLFKEWRGLEGLKKFGLIGLANFATIFGLIAAILPANTIKGAEDASLLIDKIKTKRYFLKRKISLGLIIIDAPLLIISIFLVPIFYVNLLNSFAESRVYNYPTPLSAINIIPLVISLVPIFIFILALYLRRIKKEDRILFDDLRSKKYSSWTFQPKDSRKIAFAILFSLAFLIISWAIIRLLIFSVGG